MVLQKVLRWLRSEAAQQLGPGRLARWIGRNWAHWTYAVHVEPTWLEINRHDIPIASLPASHDGLRVVQMTDFHASKHVTEKYLNEAVEMAHAQHPDVIVLTGDYIHKGGKHVDDVAKILGRLRAPLGVYAVLGNHDYSVRNALGFRRYKHLHQTIADALSDQGIRVLHNETLPLVRDGKHIFLSGVADLWSRVCDLDAALDGICPQTPRIVLAHNPCTIERLGEHRCDLMLSGHTHGGQVNLPGIGPVALGPKGRRFAAGFYRHGKSMVYVNKGVGFGLQLRYGVRPEVAVFTLRRPDLIVDPSAAPTFRATY
jgi:predicted MPP superfamily phosphohydrolase